MADLYRSDAAREAMASWCIDRLAAWTIAHQTRRLDTLHGESNVVEAGDGSVAVVYLPGTNFNAATSLALLGELSTRCRVFAVDLPGQPGLSSARRPPDAAAAQRSWVSQVLQTLPLAGAERVVLVGHSRGAHTALCADPAEVDRLVLLSPAGLMKVAATLPLLRTALPWILRPTEARSGALLRMMTAAGRAPDPDHIKWLTLVATHCRTSGAPGPVPRWCTDQWRTADVSVSAGEQDCFFPPARLAAAVRDRLGTTLEILDDVGHLSVDEAPSMVAERILQVGRRMP